MSASPGDPQPVFDLIVRRARELCDGMAAVTLFEFDGTLIHLRARCGSATMRAPPTFIALFPMAADRAIDWPGDPGQQVVHIRDLDTDPEHSQCVRDWAVSRALAIPLLRDGVASGPSHLALEPGGFSDSQIELLKTFAEQAVIAISSAETYRALQTRTADLQESLEYQTATSDVLKVDQPLGLRSAYRPRPAVDTAARLCGADHGQILAQGRRHLPLRRRVT